MNGLNDFGRRVAPGIDRGLRSLRYSSAIALAAFGGHAFAQDSAAPPAAPAPAGAAVGEIVVTAMKRSERLQDVPVAVTAIGNKELVDAHIMGNEDLARVVPSLAIHALVPGESQIIMRGINTGYGLSPAVSYYLDETPFDLRSDGYSGAPDIDFFDVARVEALRGPQGTLYGASSMGGTIRVITNAPDPRAFAVKAETGLSGTDGGSGLGYVDKLVVNAPLSSDLAARLFVSQEHTSGFVSRVLPVNGYFATSPTDPIAQKDDNTADLSSTRLALRWTPGDWKITPSVSYQRNIDDGYPYSDSDRPHYEYNGLFRSKNVERFVVGNLEIDKPLGFADLTSSTSWLDKRAQNDQDFSGQGQRQYRADGGAPNQLIPELSYLPKTYKSFVQEVRLSSDHTGPVSWTAGVFYEHTDINEQQYETSTPFGAFLAPGANSNMIFYDIIPSTDQQVAGFVDGTYKPTSQLSISAGGRYFYYNQHYAYYEGGITGDPVDDDVAGVSASKTGFNPRFNIDYKVAPSVSLYATASKGFRLGGVNPALVPAGPGATCTYQSVFQQGFAPDTLWNYELGAKTQSPDHRLTFNADGYRIDWNNIQQAVNSTCGSFVGNFGNARIYGAEAEANLRVVDGFTVSASGSYTDARFVSFNPGYANSVNISVNQPLVNTPVWQGDISGEYRIDMGDDRGVRLRLDVQYTGSTPTSYTYTTSIYTRPASTNVNAAIAGHIGKTELELFVRNIGNSYQILDILPARSRNYAENQVAPPRTIGATLRYGF
jgi:outer membrane receptor protein involved in Fe transport